MVVKHDAVQYLPSYPILLVVLHKRSRASGFVYGDIQSDAKPSLQHPASLVCMLLYDILFHIIVCLRRVLLIMFRKRVEHINTYQYVYLARVRECMNKSMVYVLLWHRPNRT